MSSLRFGDRGTEVKALQKMLNAEGYNLGADGIFGRKTEHAVRLFQAKKSLYVDGIAGRRTLAALGKKDIPRPPAPPINGNVGRQPCASMNLSSSGFNFVFRHEAQANVSNRLHWPRGKSGVTLGPGYDMGARTREEVKARLLSLGLKEEQAEKASYGAGKHFSEARQFVIDNKELIDLTAEQEKKLLELTVPAYIRAVRRRITVPLRQYEFDALVCFAYNPGSFLDKVCNFINNGQVSDAMTLISKIVYSGTERQKGLVDRRHDEVNLFLNGQY
ncbi:peptidoglycan-binding protein [Cronobacter sakazakii]|uniref:peptidoglycan-binding protein n=1 Tax=Cronobacter sakazakii TaxID=28141 RepID=UPI001AE22E88|nr:peptidoglycan-binding protein [Cronobacter sakazakii]ELY6246788.1 peptidoglycan-binding protein [Cronobacter universalis]EKK3981388.1 peptidoglycan-binding protein [Cronobacter sakazakii]EKM6343409.1 peptidoglycan-binding protein [Cronobacter sakazakii]EKM6352578.1 peptidoglycan-binding protein [Cronobacter sakazakii]EKM6368482.1 peptidoglycan-binding protein [Cronobacter sakazakii]